MTADRDYSIAHNCSISTGKRTQDMTWKQAKQEVQNTNGLSDLVFLQSESIKDIGSATCDCTNINFALVFGRFVVMEGNGSGDKKNKKKTYLFCPLF